jgi:hypothetical protein
MMLQRQRTAPPNEQRDASGMTATRQHTELHASMLLLAAGQKLLGIDAVPVNQPAEPRSLRSRNHLRRIFKRPTMARKQPPEVVPGPNAVPKLPLVLHHRGVAMSKRPERITALLQPQPQQQQLRLAQALSAARLCPAGERRVPVQGVTYFHCGKDLSHTRGRRRSRSRQQQAFRCLGRMLQYCGAGRRWRVPSAAISNSSTQCSLKFTDAGAERL